MLCPCPGVFFHLTTGQRRVGCVPAGCPASTAIGWNRIPAHNQITGWLIRSGCHVRGPQTRALVTGPKECCPLPEMTSGEVKTNLKAISYSTPRGPKSTKWGNKLFPFCHHGSQNGTLITPKLSRTALRAALLKIFHPPWCKLMRERDTPREAVKSPRVHQGLRARKYHSPAAAHISIPRSNEQISFL